MRLFIAIAFPDHVVAELCRIQPRVLPGIRPTDRAGIHLTLHFLGEYDTLEIGNALERVSAEKLWLTIDGTGQFSTRDDSIILWAGIQSCPALTHLHTAVGSALSSIGFQTESRPYSPHVTLARCKLSMARTGTEARTVIERFLAENTSFRLPSFLIEDFGLYSSTAISGGRRYQCERRFNLR